MTVSFPHRIIGSSAEQAAEKSEEQKTAKRDLEGAVAEGGETRLARLERERVRRITVQEMEKERSVRQAAFDRISENLRREEMLKHDGRLLGRLQNIANQRRSILGSIGKSQAEIAKERKAARAAAKQKKKAKQKKAKQKKKK